MTQYIINYTWSSKVEISRRVNLPRLTDLSSDGQRLMAGPRGTNVALARSIERSTTAQGSHTFLRRIGTRLWRERNGISDNDSTGAGPRALCLLSNSATLQRHSVQAVA